MLRPLPSLVVRHGFGAAAKAVTDVALFAQKSCQTAACLGFRVEDFDPRGSTSSPSFILPKISSGERP